MLAAGGTVVGLSLVWAATGLGPTFPERAPDAASSPAPSPLTRADSTVDTRAEPGSQGGATTASAGREARPSAVKSRADVRRVGSSDRRVPERADGTFTTVPVDGVVDSGATTYVVQTEDGLSLPSRDFGRAVVRTLSDPRSWAGGNPAALSLASTLESADFRVVLASPETTDALCAPLLTRGRVSCRNGGDVVINAWRWVNGADAYGQDLASYRQYVVNHEVGHALGHGHAGCATPGAPAPVMLQQTLGLQGCAANPWPLGTDLPDH